jgi:hypothetical protein
MKNLLGNGLIFLMAFHVVNAQDSSRMEKDTRIVSIIHGSSRGVGNQNVGTSNYEVVSFGQRRINYGLRIGGSIVAGSSIQRNANYAWRYGGIISPFVLFTDMRQKNHIQVGMDYSVIYADKFFPDINSNGQERIYNSFMKHSFQTHVGYRKQGPTGGLFFRVSLHFAFASYEMNSSRMVFPEAEKFRNFDGLYFEYAIGWALKPKRFKESKNKIF